MRHVGLILKEAEAEQEAFVCPHCEKEYKSAAALKTHCKKEHPEAFDSAEQ